MNSILLVIIVFTVSLLTIIGISTFYQSILPFSNTPGFIALVISLLGIYLTFHSSMIEVRLRHAQDLNKFIASWYELNSNFYVNVVPQMTKPGGASTVVYYKNQYDLNYVISNALYNDLTKAHLKDNDSHKNLKDLWEGYTSHIDYYESLIAQLRSKVLGIVKSRISNVLITDNYNVSTDVAITPNYIDILVKHYVEESTILSQMDTSFNFINQLVHYPAQGGGATTSAYTITANTRDNNYSYQLIYAKTEIEGNRYLDILKDLYNVSANDLDAEIKSLRDEIITEEKVIDDTYYDIQETLLNLNNYPIFGGKCDYVSKV